MRLHTIISIMKAVTLFSSAGIGDVAVKSSGIDIIVASELMENRALLHERNFPNTEDYYR